MGLVLSMLPLTSRVEYAICASYLSAWSLHVLPGLQGFPLGSPVSSCSPKTCVVDVDVVA